MSPHDVKRPLSEPRGVHGVVRASDGRAHAKVYSRKSPLARIHNPGFRSLTKATSAEQAPRKIRRRRRPIAQSPRIGAVEAAIEAVDINSLPRPAHARLARINALCILAAIRHAPQLCAKRERFREVGLVILSRRLIAGLMGLILTATLSGRAFAEDPIKVGVVGQFSGPFASSGAQVKQAIEIWVAMHGSKAGAHEVQFIYRDVGGPNPAVAKRLAQELVVKDHVSILTGFFLSPEASAAAPVATETKTPTVLLTAASPPLMRASPYYVRAGESIWQPAFSQADFAADSGKKRAYIAVADYAPGYDVQEGFKTRFTQKGGTIVGEDRIPLNTVDFAPFAERVANSKADVLAIFIPNGTPSISFINALAQRGVLKDTMVIGIDETDDFDLASFSDNVIGIYTSIFYASLLDNPENKAFVATAKKLYGPGYRVGANMVGDFDGVGLIYRMIEAQGEKPFDAATAMDAVRGYKWNSPRGPVAIDPETRDIIQNIYIRRVEKVDGRLENVVVRTYEAVKDPWAPLHPAK
jgi:branched-chain amino acid transport system substrate-binding protein